MGIVNFAKERKNSIQQTNGKKYILQGTIIDEMGVFYCLFANYISL
jgi:hypothetical protein